MKKIISFVLTIMLVASSMSVTAFAAEAGPGRGAGKWDITVKGNYTPGNSVDVISVDISWTEMSFDYNGGSLGTWNAATHQYEGGTAGSWSDKKARITVKNHSNCEITASFEFKAAAGLNVTGTFYIRSDGDGYTTLESDAQNFRLATAVGTTRNDENESQDTSPRDTIYFSMTGGSIDKDYNTTDSSLGTITVKIAATSN